LFARNDGLGVFVIPVEAGIQGERLLYGVFLASFLASMVSARAENNDNAL
jgi:hypothetical protein